MAGMQYVSLFLSHVPVTAQPMEDVNNPKSKLANRFFPLRHSWSTGIGVDQYYVLDLLSSRTGTFNCAVADANYTAIKIAAGTSATYNDASFTGNETSHTLVLDTWTGRYKGAFSHTFSSQRYLRYRIPAQTPIVSPLTVFLTGSLYVYNSLNLITMTNQFSDPASAEIASDYRENSFSIARENVFYITMDVSAAAITEASIGEWKSLAQVGADSPFLLHFNRGNMQEFYPMMFRPNPKVGIKGTSYTTGFSFKEITFGK